MSKSGRKIEKKILSLLHGHETRTHLREIHAHFLRHNLHNSNQILSHFLSVCCSFNNINYANRLFHQTHFPNLSIFNAMIKGCSLRGPFKHSLLLFSSMKRCGIRADEYSFAPLMKACTGFRDVRVGECVYKDVIVDGFERFSAVLIGVVEFFSVCGVMEDAKKVFDEMCERDVIVWNLMIRGWCMRGDIDVGLKLFREMNKRSLVSWNIIISCLAKGGRDSEALGLFEEMQDHGFKPDEATVVTVLPICTRLNAVDIGKRIHSYAESSGMYKTSVSVGNALVDFYNKCGFLDTARTLFNEMPRKNTICWNAMISGLAFNGKSELGVVMFDDMMNKGMRPNDSTFVGVLSCCAHAGLVEKGKNLFAAMTKHHQIEPKVEHYGCMVDLLGRSGRVREAYDLITSMPMKPNAVLWGSLLSACRTHGALELAKQAVKELIELEPWNSGNYVLLSNIYAKEDSWDDVERVRTMMKMRCVKKSPGQSAIG